MYGMAEECESTQNPIPRQRERVAKKEVATGNLFSCYCHSYPGTVSKDDVDVVRSGGEGGDVQRGRALGIAVNQHQAGQDEEVAQAPKIRPPVSNLVKEKRK